MVGREEKGQLAQNGEVSVCIVDSWRKCGEGFFSSRTILNHKDMVLLTQSWINAWWVQVVWFNNKFVLWPLTLKIISCKYFSLVARLFVFRLQSWAIFSSFAVPLSLSSILSLLVSRPPPIGPHHKGRFIRVRVRKDLGGNQNRKNVLLNIESGSRFFITEEFREFAGVYNHWSDLVSHSE